MLESATRIGSVEARPMAVPSRVMTATPTGRFPKSAHLLRHADFQRVYKQGRRHFSGNMTVFYLRRLEPQPLGDGEQATSSSPRIGFTVPKALGKAVDRNRIRRRMREAVRHHLELLGTEAVDVVFNPKRSVRDLEFELVNQEVIRAFEVIRKNLKRPPETRPARPAQEQPER